MNPTRLIELKRDGGVVPADDLREFFVAYLGGSVADYHVSAFLMAVMFRGMTSEELATLLDVMMHSGETVDFGAARSLCVDKHSTGGVGDKVSLVLAPLAASLGVRVPMISGRGLGHTGGTLDKLEAIPGFSTQLSLDEFRAQVERIGCGLIGQTAEIAPLDRRLYALRDVTGTVESIPLISASIMSKKLAEGIGGLVLDVKRGSGAFLPDLERGLELARTMVSLGAAAGCNVVALMTAMDRPLGHAIGNALETEEAILSLRGEGPADLRELTIAQTAEMVVLAGIERDIATARAAAERALDDGRALEKMREIVTAQGGDPNVLDDPAIMAQAATSATLEADRAGYVGAMDVRAIGRAAVALGAGRAAVDDRIDPGVGFMITVKPGSAVRAGDALATVFAASDADARAGIEALRRAMPIGDERPELLPLVSHRVTSAGVEPVA